MGRPGKSILIASGGTGGHIFPAIVFGRWLERNAGASVTYLSGCRPVEAAIYASAGITPRVLTVEGSPLGVRSPMRILKRTMSMFRAFGETSACLKDAKPDAVFLFGGYVSFAPLLMCRLRKVPVVIHEQNAVAGRVTRLASRLGASIAAGWNECLGGGNFTTVGVPTREPARLGRAEALAKLGLDMNPGARIVGVAMGSLGSPPLARAVMDAAAELEEKNIETVLLGDAPDGAGVPRNAHFVGRQWDMNPFYSVCDALVCRAGGSTLAEALNWGLPTVTVPWDGAAGGHQERNARCFAGMGGGVIWHNGDGPLSAAMEACIERGPHAAPEIDPCASLARLGGLN